MRWENNLDFRFNLLLADEIEAISNKLTNLGIDYKSICETYEGNIRRHKRAELFPESVDVLTPLHKPLLIGEKSGDVVRYPYYRFSLEWIVYVNYDPTICTSTQ